MESASVRAANEKEEISTESRHDKNEQRCEKDKEIKAHIEERKTSINMTNAWRMSAKRSKGASGTKKRAKRLEKIQQILEELKGIGIKNMSIIKSSRKKTLIPKIRDEKFEIITSKNNRTKKIALTMKRRWRITQSWKTAKNRTKKADQKKLETRKRKVKAYFNSQTKKCKLPLSASKKENLETTMEPKLKASKDALRRQKDEERNLQRRDYVQRHYPVYGREWE